MAECDNNIWTEIKTEPAEKKASNLKCQQQQQKF